MTTAMTHAMPMEQPPTMVDRAATVPLTVIVGITLSAYLSWRPSVDIMFTISDACLLLGAMLLLLRRRVPLEPFGVVSPAWFGGFILMMGGLLASSLFSGDPTRWPTVALQYSMAWVVLPFLIMGHDRRDTERLVRFFVAGVVAMALIGIRVYFTFNGTFVQARALLGFDFISGSGRLGAFATDANWNGATIAMALPFTFYLRGRRMISMWQAAIAITILVFALTLTASVTAFGSACTATLLFVVAGGVRLRPGPLAAMLLFLAVGSTIALSAYGLPPVFEKRVATVFETGDLATAGTFKGRMGLIEDAWQRVGDSMLVGVGVDQDRVVSPLRAPVHNMYLLVWVEGGFIALFGWVAMMTAGLAIAFAALWRDRLAGVLAFTVLTTFLLFSAASPHMYARLWAVPVLLALAVALHSGGPHLRDMVGRRHAARWKHASEPQS